MSVFSYENIIRNIVWKGLVLLAKGSGLFPHSGVILSNVVDNAADDSQLCLKLLNDVLLSESSIIRELTIGRVLTYNVLCKSD